ncbi:hypothetical protein K439DRAFT_1311580, partial [Ramaria rubella]
IPSPLFSRCLGAVNNDLDLKQHHCALMKLGVEGMSSDESDMEDGKEIYRISTKPWRAQAVTMWLRAMDCVHLSIRAKRKSGVMPGSWPREHHDGTKVSIRCAVPGLPHTFYAEDWLAGL